MREKIKPAIDAIEKSLNYDHYNGYVEGVGHYWGNSDDPDVVVKVSGEFANVGRALRTITRREDVTIDYITHTGNREVPQTRIALDYHGSDPKGTMFTEDL